MAKDPAFLFYPNDWLGGTIGMNFDLQGAYLTLLILQFNKGEFSEQQALNVVGEKRWIELKEKFETDGSLFWNIRLRDEHAKRKRFSEHQRENVKKRYQTTYQNSTKPPTNNLPLENEDENKNENKSLIEIKIEEFYNFRKELKKPILDSSKESFLKKLNKLSNGNNEVAIEILDESISNGWQGIFPLKNNANQNGTKQGQTNYHSNKADVAQLAEQTRNFLKSNQVQDGGGGD